MKTHGAAAFARPGVGPYTREDLANLTGLDAIGVGCDIESLEQIGLLDEVVVEGETYLRVVDFRPLVRRRLVRVRDTPERREQRAAGDPTRRAALRRDLVRRSESSHPSPNCRWTTPASSG